MSAETIAALAFFAFAIGATAMMIAFAVNIFRDGEEMRAANRAERERRKERVNVKWEIGGATNVAEALRVAKVEVDEKAEG